MREELIIENLLTELGCRDAYILNYGNYMNIPMPVLSKSIHDGKPFMEGWKAWANGESYRLTIRWFCKLFRCKSFSWSSTPEGVAYWWDIHDKLLMSRYLKDEHIAIKRLLLLLKRIGEYGYFVHKFYHNAYINRPIKMQLGTIDRIIYSIMFTSNRNVIDLPYLVKHFGTDKVVCFSLSENEEAEHIRNIQRKLVKACRYL